MKTIFGNTKLLTTLLTVLMLCFMTTSAWAMEINVTQNTLDAVFTEDTYYYTLTTGNTYTLTENITLDKYITIRPSADGEVYTIDLGGNILTAYSGQSAIEIYFPGITDGKSATVNIKNGTIVSNGYDAVAITGEIYPQGTHTVNFEDVTISGSDTSMSIKNNVNVNISSSSDIDSITMAVSGTSQGFSMQTNLTITGSNVNSMTITNYMHEQHAYASSSTFSVIGSSTVGSVTLPNDETETQSTSATYNTITLNVSGLTAGGSVGIEVTDDNKDQITGVGDTYEVATGYNNIYYRTSETAVVAVQEADCACPVCGGFHGVYVATADWTEITEITSGTTTLADGGAYYLANDVTGTIQLPTSGTATLCLGTRTLTGSIQSSNSTTDITTLNIYSGNGGTVSSSTSSVYLYNDNAVLNIYGGTYTSSTISNATAYILNGTLNMYGGTINSTTTGGVLIGSAATFNMSGGTIEDNNADTDYGVFTTTTSGATFNLSSDASIENGVYLKNYDDVIAFTGAYTGTPIAVTFATALESGKSQVITSGASTGGVDTEDFTSTQNYIITANAAGEIAFLNYGGEEYCGCGETHGSSDSWWQVIEENGQLYKDINDSTANWGVYDASDIEIAGNTLTAGNYYLGEDVDPNTTITINGTVNLCLNDKTIDGASNSSTSVITVPSGATLNLYDGSTNEGIIKGGNATYGGGINVAGTLNMHGGTISNNIAAAYGGGVYAAGTFTMSAGTISGNTATTSGGGVYVANNAEFTMSGGTIGGDSSADKNTANAGGGVYVYGSGSEFTMSGGTISYNTATSGNGGGVLLSSGTFAMSAGEISNNTASSNGGGVYAADTFTMSGTAKISSNAANTNGGGVYVSSGTFTMSDTAEISSNRATSNGGGVLLSAGEFTMSGGTITGNAATTNGDGVYMGDTFKISGSPSITANYKDATSQTAAGTEDGDGVYLASGKTITITAALTNAIAIPVTAADGEGAEIAADGGTVLDTTTNYADQFTDASTNKYSTFYRTSVDSIYFATVAANAGDFNYLDAADNDNTVTKTYDGDTQSVTPTLLDDANAQITVSYTDSTGATVTNPTNAGVYDVSVSVSGSSYFADTTTPIQLGTLTIEKATPTIASTTVYVTGDEDKTPVTEFSYEDKITVEVQFDGLVVGVGTIYPTGMVQPSVSYGNTTHAPTAVTIDESGLATIEITQLFDVGDLTITYNYIENTTTDDNFKAVTGLTDGSSKVTDSLTVAQKEVTFTVSGEDATYKASENQTVTITGTGTTDLKSEDFTITYYKVDEDTQLVNSTEATYTIAMGEYLYVIDFASDDSKYDNYTLGEDTEVYTFSDTTLARPSVASYNNIGYMTITSSTSAQQNPISFGTLLEMKTTTDEDFTFTATGATSGAAITYTSSNTEVATVNLSTGEVSILTSGTTQITATATLGGYDDVYAYYTVYVSNTDVTITAPSTTITYGEEFDDTFKNELSVIYPTGMTATDFDITGLTFSTDYTTGDGVGYKSITVSGITSDKYDITFAPGTLTVEQKDIDADDLTFTVADKTYDGTTTATGTVEFGAGVLVNSDPVTVDFDVEFVSAGVSDVVTATFTFNGLKGSNSSNYNLMDSTYTTSTETNDTAEISTNELTFTVGTTSFEYDGTAKAVTITAKDAYGKDFTDFTVSYSQDGSSVSSPTAAGNYDITIAVADTTNYDITSWTDETLEIEVASQDSLVIVGALGTVSYGDTFTLSAIGGTSAVTTEWTVTGTGVTISETTGDKTIVTVNGSVGEEVTITATKTDDDNNYSTVYDSITFTPVAKAVNITISNIYQTYNSTSGNAVTATASDSNATLSTKYYTDSAFTQGEATTVSAAGTYYVKTTATGNYSGSQTAILTVAKADVSDTAEFTLTVDDIIYGETVAPEASTVEGFTAGTVTYSSTPTNAGDYTAYVTFTSANYNDVTIETDFTIAKKELTVTVKDNTPDDGDNNYTREFGEENPEFELEYSGWITGDENYDLYKAPTASTTATSNSNVGSYDITISGGSDPNYSFITTATGTLTVNALSDEGDYFVVSSASNTANVGDEFTLYAYYGSEKITDVTWSLTDAYSTVASIDENTGVVTTLTAGSVSFTATYGTNYSSATATYTVTVNTEEVTLIASGLTHTYDGDAKSVTISSNNENFKVDTTVDTGNVIVTYQLIGSNAEATTTAPTKAGSYWVTYSIASNLYQGSGSTFMTIKEATFENSGLTFDVADWTYGATGTVEVAGNLPVVASVSYEYSTANGTIPTNAGEYRVTATISADNYDEYTLSDTFEIAKAVLTVTADDVEITHGDAIPTFTLVYKDSSNTDISGYTFDVAPTVSTTATALSGAGVYDVNVTDGYDENYTFSFENPVAKLTISAADAEIFSILDAQTEAFVGETFTVSAYIGETVTTDVTWLATNTDGTVTITSNLDGSATIEALTKGTVTVTATYIGSAYTNKTATFDLEILENSGTLAISNATQTYDGTGKYVTLTNTSENGFEVVYTPENNEDIDNVTVTYNDLATLPTDAGTYTVKYVITEAGFEGEGYGTLTIEKAVLEVTADDAEREYGKEDPVFTLEYIGWVTGDETGYTLDQEPTATTTSSTTSAVGSEHTITVSGGEDANYTFSYDNSGKLTITQAIVDADDANFIIFGGLETMGVSTEMTVAAVLDTITVGATWESDDEAIATVVDGKITAVSAGSVTITATLNDTNYVTNDSETPITATLTINVQNNVVTLVPDETTFEYDGYAQELTFTASDVNLDLINLEFTYYDLTTNEIVSELRNAGNYSVSYSLNEDGTLISGSTYVTITKANVTVQPTNKEKTYGDVNPEFTFTGLLGDDRTTYYDFYAEMFVLSTEADENSDVGEYDITMEFAAGHDETSSRNYYFTISETDGTLTVNKKDLTVKVDNATRPYGEENEDPTYTVEGFVLSQDETDLGGELVFTYANATSTSDIGTYEDEITADGYTSDNYEISYGYEGDTSDYGDTAADLEITAIEVTVSATTSRSTYLQVKFSESVEAGWLTFTVTDANGDAVTITSETETTGTNFYLYGTFSTSTTYTVVVELDDADGNYTMTDTTLSIKPTSTSTSSGGGGGGSSSSSSTEYDVEIADTENGTVSTEDDSYEEGDDVEITITPDEDYEIDEVIVLDEDEDEIEVDLDDYTFEMPESDVEIFVTFKAIVEYAEFPDVSDKDYFYDAVNWAIQNGITTGFEDGTFRPYDLASRAQTVTFLWRAAGSPEVTSENPFTDVKSTDYYYDAVLWAVSEGITNGATDTTFEPDATVSRGQIVTFLWRMADAPEVTSENPFTDLEAGYHYDAVLWAVYEEITNGTTDTTFEANDDCTRAQVVTFLYRYFVK